MTVAPPTSPPPGHRSLIPLRPAPKGHKSPIELSPATGTISPGREKMASRRRRLDPVGPFGNPDGSRADIEDLISEFVDFGGNPAFGHLATRANDSQVRVIVGRLGAGKTVYLRRLQDFQ